MELIFVGTSDGIPLKDRHCSCYMLKCGGAVYFIDAGTSLYDAMRDHGVSADGLRAVFTTHPHGDHVNGLIHTVAMLAWRKPELGFDVYLTRQELIDAMVAYTKATFHPDSGDAASGIKMHLASAGEVYRDGNISVTYYLNKHIKFENCSYSILVRELCEGGGSILFSGDLSQGLSAEDYPTAAYEGQDLMLCEMAHFETMRPLEYFKRSRICALALTHVNRRALRQPDIETLISELPYPTRVAADGDRVRVNKGEVQFL